LLHGKENLTHDQFLIGFKRHDYIMDNNFILQHYIENLNICDELIGYYEKSPNKVPGGVGNVNKVLKDIKNCNQIFLEYNDLPCFKYYSALGKILDLYMMKFPFCNQYSPFRNVEGGNLQHYAPNQGFYSWHSERTGMALPNGARHLVFMTYLNDVTDGGETEFYHQKLKIQPKKGLTLIWPADWTYTHRGIVSSTQDKYIATGWYSYVA